MKACQLTSNRRPWSRGWRHFYEPSARPNQRALPTTELGKLTGLARPTAHRLLTSLAAEGLVDRDARTGRWSLGPELYLLGAAAGNRYDITDRARDVVDELARVTGESAFLSARRG